MHLRVRMPEFQWIIPRYDCHRLMIGIIQVQISAKIMVSVVIGNTGAHKNPLLFSFQI
jgi:hypothetical protein